MSNQKSNLATSVIAWWINQKIKNSKTGARHLTRLNIFLSVAPTVCIVSYMCIQNAEHTENE